MKPILAESIVIYRSKLEQSRDEFWFDLIGQPWFGWVTLGVIGVLILFVLFGIFKKKKY